MALSNSDLSNKNNVFIKNNIENFMIKARKYGNTVAGMNMINNSKSNASCVDPEQIILENKSLDMMKIFYDGFNILDYPPVSRVLDNYKVLPHATDNEHDSLEYGAKQCNESSLKILHDHERGLCPWHYKVEYRSDRYPIMRMQAKCNCGSCFFFNSNKTNEGNEFNCRQIRKLMPTLVRGNCVNGVYNWNIMFEHVSIACMCMKELSIDIDAF